MDHQEEKFDESETNDETQSKNTDQNKKLEN